MSIIKIISQVRSGVVQIIFEHNRDVVGSGSGFLVEGGLITNSHVIRAGTFDVMRIRLSDTDPEDPESYYRLLSDSLNQSIIIEDSSKSKDYVFLSFNEPELEERYRFSFAKDISAHVGERVSFLGFPFGMAQLTAHIGYISSKFEKNGIEIFQIDGSINNGNSGGPLINDDGDVIGLITRAVTGIIEEQFNQLIEALRSNQVALENAQAVLRIGSIDPIDAIRASQSAMESIAINLKRSANVGIGYAYSSKYIRDAIKNL
jgi:S1-C subfamily serine protease